MFDIEITTRCCGGLPKSRVESGGILVWSGFDMQEGIQEVGRIDGMLWHHAELVDRYGPDAPEVKTFEEAAGHNCDVFQRQAEKTRTDYGVLHRGDRWEAGSAILQTGCVICNAFFTIRSNYPLIYVSALMAVVGAARVALISWDRRREVKNLHTRLDTSRFRIW